MAFQHTFSVGTINVGSNNLGVATEISVSYDGDIQTFYGGDYRKPLAAELGNRTGEVRARTARFDIAEDPLDNVYATVTLGVGGDSGGLSGSLTACKVSSLEVTSSQNEFVTSNFTMIITSTQASSASKGGAWQAWA